MKKVKKLAAVQCFDDFFFAFLIMFTNKKKQCAHQKTRQNIDGFFSDFFDQRDCIIGALKGAIIHTMKIKSEPWPVGIHEQKFCLLFRFLDFVTVFNLAY